MPTPEEYESTAIQPLGDRQTFYTENIAGCVNFYGSGGGKCISNERERIKMSLRQPKSMVNYTETGYTKIRAPDEVLALLREFWEANRHAATNEKWKPGYVRLLHELLSFHSKECADIRLLLSARVFLSNPAIRIQIIGKRK